MARIPVFLSAPKPYLIRQREFLQQVEQNLRGQGLEPRTLGRSDYDMDAPLEAIRRLMYGSCGLIAIAFRRAYVSSAVDRPESDLGEPAEPRGGTWLTSPYCQLEPAMAYQIGLPILIWTESGVRAEGILDRGAAGIGMPSFNLDSTVALQEEMWREPLSQWVSRVHSVYRNRAAPPKLW
jgi:hypothetical protein